MQTDIPVLNYYLERIGATPERIVACWEQGSFVEGIADEFSDRDFQVVWKDSIPSAEIRTQVATALGFEIHEIKDITSIETSFDMMKVGNTLINIAYQPKEKIEAFHQTLNRVKPSSDTERILIGLSALESARIYYQEGNWWDTFKHQSHPTEETRETLIAYYGKQASYDLLLLHKSSARHDPLQFIKYLERVLRYLQIVYLLKNQRPVTTTKFFAKRFAPIEQGHITKIVQELTKHIDMPDFYTQTLKAANELGIEESEKYKA